MSPGPHSGSDADAGSDSESDPILGENPEVVTVGVDMFATTLSEMDTTVTDVDWSPPPADSIDHLTALAQSREAVTSANATAVKRLIEATAIWRDVKPAAAVLPDFAGQTVLHAGPPVTWGRMSGPQRGAVIGAVIYEGWADTPADAQSLVESGEITLDPCHEHQAVGPMAGIISPSMPVVVVENEVHETVAYSTLNEGLGKVLRFGAYSEEVITHLDWLESTVAPVLSETLTECDGVDLTLISAKALQMGDEIHNRNVAATSMLVRTIAPTIAALEDERTADVLSFMKENDHFFLNLSMAACKAAADAAADIPWSTVVTALSRNGTDFGIRVSGLGDRWFTTEAPVIDGLFFPEYDADDANPDMGDSSIAETTGVGGFAMAGSPSITQFVGGTPADARRFTREMYRITVDENAGYAIPALDFRGTPTGIDIARVVETGTAPVINTGIAHTEPGVGQIGAGITRAPMACFTAALEAFAETYLEGSEVDER